MIPPRCPVLRYVVLLNIYICIFMACHNIIYILLSKSLTLSPYYTVLVFSFLIYVHIFLYHIRVCRRSACIYYLRSIVNTCILIIILFIFVCSSVCLLFFFRDSSTTSQMLCARVSESHGFA